MDGSQHHRSGLRLVDLRELSDNLYEAIVEDENGIREQLIVRVIGDYIETPYGLYRIQDLLATTPSAKQRSSLVEDWAVMYTSEGLVKSKLSLKVVEVKVSKGDVVEKNSTLMIVETMKMVCEVRSPCRGVVEEVYVQPGSGVKPGTSLLRLKCS